MRRFQKEGGFKHEPFAALTKPFLELAKSWSPLGTIEVIGKPELQEVRGAALASQPLTVTER